MEGEDAIPHIELIKIIVPKMRGLLHNGVDRLQSQV